MIPLHTIMLYTQQSNPRQVPSETNKTRINKILRNIMWNCMPFHFFFRFHVHSRTTKFKNYFFVLGSATGQSFLMINGHPNNEHNHAFTKICHNLTFLRWLALLLTCFHFSRPDTL